MSAEKPKAESAQAPVVKLPADTTNNLAAADAMEEILDQTILNVLNNVRPEQLQRAKANVETRKGMAYRSTAWVHAPGNLELLSVADSRLSKVGNWDGINGHVMSYVHAKLVPDTKYLIVKAAREKDLTAYEVRRYARQSSAWINLYDLLAPEGLTVETGYRELYTVAFVPKSSPLWPALVIDLGSPKERRQEPKRKKKEEEEDEAE